MRETVDILGIPIDVLTGQQALEQASRWLEQGRGEPAHIVTANPEMIMQAGDDRALAQILMGAQMVVADGTGVVWASRILGRPVPHRIPGIDLTSALLERCATLGKSVYLLGAEPGVAEKAAGRLIAKYPGLQVAGTRHGFFTDAENDAVVEHINISGASLLLVAMGVPRQERWIAKNKERLSPHVTIGVGGALDVFAGIATRAPRWVQELGLEWAYRVVRDPKRFKRLGALPRFVVQTLRVRMLGGGHSR